MRQEKEQQQDHIGLDLSYILRHMLKNGFVIFMCAMIAGIGSYLFLDNYLRETYTASIQLSVVARDNSSGSLVDSGIGAAAARSVNVLNSDMLRVQIRKAEKNRSLNGSLQAVSVDGTNLITMKASDRSAEGAFRLLQAALDNYPKLSSYFETGYRIKNMDTLSAENITVTDVRPVYYAFLAALLVLAAGVALTGGMCILTDKIHGKEQAESILDMDFLGILHFVKKKKGQKSLLISQADTDLALAVEVDKMVSRMQEKMAAEHAKILMVTSLQENEGKSTVASNVALNLEKRGKKVLLMDADLRRPALAKIFDRTVDTEKEFASYLKGKNSLKQLVDQDGEKKGLHYIWQAKPAVESDKLLAKENLGQAIREAAETVDYVIIDTPPIGIVRDAEMIAGFSDAVLMVVRQDQTRAAALNDAVDILDETDAAVLGCVLNMAKGATAFKNRKNHYSDYYGYGY